MCDIFKALAMLMPDTVDRIGAITGWLPSFTCVLELPQSRYRDFFFFVPPLLWRRERAALPSPYLQLRRLMSHVLKVFERAESQHMPLGGPPSPFSSAQHRLG